MTEHLRRGSIECPRWQAVTGTPASTPNATLVLSLDGAGIKGYSTLLILQSIMIAVAEEERLQNPNLTSEELEKFARPSEYFHYIVGTSTGGLIATMLGRLKLTVEQCLAEYRQLGSEIFAHPRKVHAKNKLWAGSKYDYRQFERVIDQVVANHKVPPPSLSAPDNDLGRGPWRDFRDPEPSPIHHHCKTVAVSAKKSEGDGNPALWLFRSYIHRPSGNVHTPNPSSNSCLLSIREVARATSAAPPYFKVFSVEEIDGRHHEFMDGGILANNPSLVAWNEVLQMARVNNLEPRTMGCFISIGTGTSKYQIFGRERQSALAKYFKMNKAPKKMLTDTVRTPKKILEYSLTSCNSIPSTKN